MPLFFLSWNITLLSLLNWSIVFCPWFCTWKFSLSKFPPIIEKNCHAVLSIKELRLKCLTCVLSKVYSICSLNNLHDDVVFTELLVQISHVIWEQIPINTQLRVTIWTGVKLHRDIWLVYMPCHLLNKSDKH